MATPIDELSVRITGHPEGDPEPNTLTSGWGRTIQGRRDIDRPALRSTLIEAAGLSGTPHVLGEQYTETSWETPAAALEIDIAVRVDVLEGGPAKALAATVSEIFSEVPRPVEEDEAVDLARWHLAVALDHHPEQIQIERVAASDDEWSIRALSHLGAFECQVHGDGSVSFRRVPRFS
jgi:hypothetical protein